MAKGTKQTAARPQPPAPAAPARRRLSVDAAVCLGLVAITLVAFLGSCRNGFVDYDDPDYVTANPHVRAGLTADGLAWALTSTEEVVVWAPLAWWSLQLDAQLYGQNAAGFHLTSILLHAASAVLLFRVLRVMSGDVWPSAAVAAVFAVHPLRVEAVAWVSERKDVLATLGWMLTLLAYARYARSPGLGRYMLVVGAMVLGLLAKPTLVTLPAVLLLLDYWPLGRWQKGSAARLILEKVPLLALTVAASVLTMSAQSLAVRTLEQFPLDVRIGTALVAYLQYLGMLVWPDGLAAFYPHPRTGVLSAAALASAVVLIGITVLAVRQARRRPYLLVGWLWYVVTLVPMIGLVQVGGHGRADRYTYVPLIGITIGIAWALAEVIERVPERRRAAGIATAAVVGVLVILTWQQVGYWKDSVTLWRHAVDVTTDNAVAHRGLAVALEQSGDAAGALEHYRKAIEGFPDRRVVHNDLGALLMRRGETDEALKHFREAYRLEPNDPVTRTNLGGLLVARGEVEEARTHLEAAIRSNPQLAAAHFNLALCSVAQDRFDEADVHFEAGRQLEPGNSSARHQFGATLRDRGQPARAEPHLRAAIELRPDLPEPHYDLGWVLEDLLRFPAAVDEYRQAVRLNSGEVRYLIGLAHAEHAAGEPLLADTHYTEAGRIDPSWPVRESELAWRLAVHPDAKGRNGLRAVRLAEQVCQATSYSEANFLDTLAAAYAEVGRFGEAVSTARQAVERARAGRDEAFTRELQDRLRLYESRQPFRARLAPERP